MGIDWPEWWFRAWGTAFGIWLVLFIIIKAIIAILTDEPIPWDEDEEDPGDRLK